MRGALVSSCGSCVRLGLNQEDTGDLQVPAAELGDRERGVVDGSERRPGDQQDGEAEVSRRDRHRSTPGRRGRGGHRRLRPARPSPAAASSVARSRIGSIEIVRPSRAAAAWGAAGRRSGIEADARGRDGCARGGVKAEGVEGLGVDARLRGLEGDEAPPALASRTEEGAADHGLAHAGVGAGDEQAGERSGGDVGALIGGRRRGRRRSRRRRLRCGRRTG